MFADVSNFRIQILILILEIVRIKTTNSLKNRQKSNAITLYKSKKPESINKKFLTNNQKKIHLLSI